MANSAAQRIIGCEARRRLLENCYLLIMKRESFLECGDLSPLWPSRPVATLLATGRQRPKRRQVGALPNIRYDLNSGVRRNFVACLALVACSKASAYLIIFDSLQWPPK